MNVEFIETKQQQQQQKERKKERNVDEEMNAYYDKCNNMFYISTFIMQTSATNRRKERKTYKLLAKVELKENEEKSSLIDVREIPRRAVTIIFHALEHS
jgi:hypothetical protein